METKVKFVVNKSQAETVVGMADGYISATKNVVALQKFKADFELAKKADMKRLQFFHAYVDAMGQGDTCPATMDITVDGKKLSGNALTKEFQKRYPRFNALSYLLRKATADAQPPVSETERRQQQENRKNAPARVAALAIKHGLSLEGLTAFCREFGRFIVQKDNSLNTKVETEYAKLKMLAEAKQHGKTQSRGKVTQITKRTKKAA